MDTQVFEEIVKNCTPPLYRYCSYRLSYNHQLTEEAVNDIWRILFVKWDSLDINENIMGYLYRVADNCIKQAKERDFKYYSHHSSYDRELHEGTITEPYYFDDYFHDQNSEEEFISDMVESLSDEYKSIFIYRYIEKRTITEIAEITHLPYSSVRIRLKKIEAYVKREVINNY